MIQDAIWNIALTGMGLVAVGFIYIISQASKPADAAATSKSAHTSNVLRRWLFGALLVVFVTGSYATLHRFPIPSQDASLDARQIVDVIGQQWSWVINPATVQTGTPVEFRISSRDVNHGFAIYAPDGRIAIEAQAMPGFTNKLLYTFTAPGTYKVMCLEYCGLGHAPMTSQFQVVAARGD